MESQTVEELREILASIVSQGESPRIGDASELDVDTTFADMGINSIDLMEFVLGVENHFNISLLDESEPHSEPETLAQWAAIVDQSAKAM